MLPLMYAVAGALALNLTGASHSFFSVEYSKPSSTTAAAGSPGAAAPPPLAGPGFPGSASCFLGPVAM